MANANDTVVNLQHPEQRWHGSPGVAAQTALGGVYERVVRVLQDGVRQALDKADDALYLRAENAQNHSEYTEYFEAMRGLRRVRTTIGTAFINGMTRYFERGCPLDITVYEEPLLHGAGKLPTRTPDVEESLAIDVLIDKIRNSSGTNLSALDRRIGFLIGDPDLEHWRNPVGPEAVCTSFCQATACLQAGLVMRLLIYKLFDQYVATQLPALYRETAQVLARAGVLSGSTGGQAGAAGAAHRPPAVSRPGRAPERIPMAPGIEPSQRSQPLWPESDSVPLAPGIVPDRPYLESEPGREGGIAGSGLDALIHKVVDLCSVPMAPGIVPSGAPGPAPRKGHPLTMAYGTQDSASADPLPPMDGLETAAAVCENSILATPPGKAVRQIGEIVAAEYDSVPAPVDEASSQSVTDTVSDRVAPQAAPDARLDFVRTFIAGHWKNLLYLVSAREGKNSDAWHEVVTTMDALTWSVKPKRTAEQCRRLTDMRPGLIDRLRLGMQRLSVDPDERDAFLARLAIVHGCLLGESLSEGGKLGRDDVKQRTAISGEPPPDVESIATTPACDVQPDGEAMAGRLKSGDRVEFIASDGSRTRTKLTWEIPVTRTLLFTDERGLQAGHYTREALAELFRRSRARVIGA